jgi:hypothetical protein
MASGIDAEDLRLWIIYQNFEVSPILPKTSGLLRDLVKPFGVSVELPPHHVGNKFLEIGFWNRKLAIESQIVKDDRRVGVCPFSCARIVRTLGTYGRGEKQEAGDSGPDEEC